MLNSENVRTRKINWSADMRYQGQSYELNIQIDNPIRTRKDVQKIVDKFHRKHQEIYEYSSKDEKVEFVNLRVTAVGVSPKIKLPKIKKGTEKSSHAIKDTRKVYFEETGFETVNIYDRAKLLANNVIHGPCVIEERMSTTVLIPESKGIVDFYGNIIIDVR
jgi:N-methylhydantoinase A